MATCGENCRLCHESLPPITEERYLQKLLKVFAQLIEVTDEQVIVQPLSLVDNDVM